MLRAFSATIRLVTLPSRVTVPEMVTTQASRTPTSWMGQFTGHTSPPVVQTATFPNSALADGRKGLYSELWKQRVFPGLFCISWRRRSASRGLFLRQIPRRQEARGSRWRSYRIWLKTAIFPTCNTWGTFKSPLPRVTHGERISHLSHV